MALEEITAPEASEFSLETEDIQQQNTGLDLSGAADDALDLFHGLNIDAIAEDDKLINTVQSNGSPEQVVNAEGPGDPKPKSLADAQNIFRKGQIRDKVTSGNLGNIVGSSRNVYQAAKAYRFDKFKSNVERYQAYGEETFNKLGFNPLVDDNEAYYNANTSRLQEWKRMFGQFGALSSNAFTSGYRSISNALSEGDVLSLDEEGNDVFSEANRIGASTKGGFTGFATNLTLNAAYSIGITANILFEEAAIWAGGILLAPETGGASFVAAAAAQGAEAANIASKTGRIKKALNIAFGGSELGKVATNGVKMIKGLAKAEDAKTIYQYAKGFGKGTVNFFNPFRQTTETLRGIYKGEAAYRNVSNAAKMSRSFGSFYRDMREAAFTVSEADLEGAGVKQERLDENIKIFQEQNNGTLPTGKDLDDAYANAYAAGRVDALGNIPLIFLTNRITLDKVFKFKGVGRLIEGFEKGMGKGLAKKFTLDAGSKTIVRKAEEGLWKGGLSTIKKLPKTITGGALWYTKANWAEGVQELGQEWLGGTTKEYYKKLYTDPAVNQAKLLKTSIYDNLKNSIGSEQSWESVKANIFSKQGLGTFASGFLMGGLIGGSKYSVTQLASNIYTKMGEAYMNVTNPEAFEAYKKDKLELEEKHIAVLNNLLSTPENFFNKRYQSFYNQKNNASSIDESERNKDDKGFHDSKDSLTFEHVNEALDNGTFDLVLDGYKELSKLSDTELADYFNTQDGAKAREKLNDFQGRAEEIKKRYDYIEETFPNPFNPKNFERGSEDQKNEFIAHKGYEEAKKAAIFSQHGFDRSLQRMVGISNDLLSNPPLKKINQTELSVILNPDTIASEVKLLRQEGALLQQSDDAEDRKLGKNKLKKASILQQYALEFEKASEEKDYSKLSKVYKAYLKALANEKKDYLFDTNVDDSFQKIMDHYNLSDDSKMYMANVNYLTNPNNLIRHAQRITAVLNEMYDNRENIGREGINNFFNVVELNSFIDSLNKISIAIDPEELIELYKTGAIPQTFFDIKSGKEISKNDPRVATIQGMLDLFVKLKKNVQRVYTPSQETQQQTSTEPTEETETTEQPEEKPEVDKDLQSKLEDAYNAFIDESGSDMSFDDFVATHPTATRIKSEMSGGTTVIVEEPETSIDIEKMYPSQALIVKEYSKEDNILLEGEDYENQLERIEKTITSGVKKGLTREQIFQMLSANGHVFALGGDTITVNNFIQNRIDGKETRPFKDFVKNTRDITSSTTPIVTPTPVSDIEAKRAELQSQVEKIQKALDNGEYGHGLVGSSTSGVYTSGDALGINFTKEELEKYNNLYKKHPEKFVNNEDVNWKERQKEKDKLIREILERGLKETKQELAALEGKTTPTQEVVVEEPNQRQQIAQEKIDKILEGVAFKDLPKAFDELINLIKAGELTSDEAEAAYAKKFEELSNKLELTDFIKGDVITFKDGRKGIVMDVTKDGLNMKMFDGPGVIEKIGLSKINNNVASVKNTKQAIDDSKKEPVVEVSTEDEDNMKKSQEGAENLATDSQRASSAIDEGVNNATDQPPGFGDLFFGCD